MIVFAHLLNDMSGSPRVLRGAIAALSQAGCENRLYIGDGGPGLLDGADIRKERYWYRRSRYRPVTLATYLASQFLLYLRLHRARDIPRDAVIYVNTLLPFAAAMWGRRSGRHVVFHLHEVSITPAPLRWFLTTVARRTASLLIYVSEDHRGRLPIPGVPAQTLPNAVDGNLLARAAAAEYRSRREEVFTVLMLASLRGYKGIPEFTALATDLQQRQDIRFLLVLNEDEANVRQHFASLMLPANMAVHARSANPAEYYAAASLVVNLSRPDQWVETFGLTLVEAMAFGIPVIAPPVGGPAEIVTNGQEGFLVDSREGEVLRDRVLRLADDENLCLRMSLAARRRAAAYSPDCFAASLRLLLEPLCDPAAGG